ncbi:MAG: glycosyltransferase family 4 protein [Verrucomicrobia bacterium]|nr:glycosyltransferase family 4 protein [Verrucomicrobiota bacterium]
MFNRYLNPGGEEKSVARIAEDLESDGHSVMRFWRESAEWKQPGAPPKWKQPFLFWHNPTVLEELGRLQASTRSDLWLLHNVMPVVSLGVYGAGRALNVPMVQWLHNYRPISPSGNLAVGSRRLEPEDRWLAWKEVWAGSWNGRFLTMLMVLGCRRVQRRGDFDAVRAWVAVSSEVKAIFARAGWYSDRLHVVRHSWHVQAPHVSDRDDGHFLFLGRMVETKGVRFIVDLWRDPALRHTTLVMAGQGPLADELRGHTPPNVRWVGHVEGAAKRELVAGCRAVLFPCLWEEPLSTVAYEAYEFGKPVLASKLGGMKEIVLEGRTGRLLEPGQAAVWRDAVMQLDADSARRLGLAGRQWLEENASPAVWNRQFRAVVAKALSH